jgi:hypothetical protein
MADLADAWMPVVMRKRALSIPFLCHGRHCRNFVRQPLRRPPEPKVKPVRHERILSSGMIMPVGFTRPASRDVGTDLALNVTTKGNNPKMPQSVVLKAAPDRFRT